MNRNKLWFLNAKNQLYPILANDNPFQQLSRIKRESSKISGVNFSSLKENDHHYVLGGTGNQPSAYIHTLQYSNKKLPAFENDQSILKQYGLHTHSHLPDERLFLFRMLHLKALVWTRVNTKMVSIGNPHIVERNSADLIAHQDEGLSEIILRQAEVVAARALYAVQLDIGSVLLAISGTGTIAVRQLFSLEDRTTDSDDNALRQALRLWQMNRARPQQTIDARYHASISKQQINKQKNSPLILGNTKASKKVATYQIEKRSVTNEHTDEEHLFEHRYEPFMYDQDPSLWLGADPELIFVDSNNQIVPAVEVLKDDPLGRYGFDSVISQQTISFPVAEIRPDPKQTPEELFLEIESILNSMFYEGVDHRYKWLSGGMPNGVIALGGHLHYSGVPLTSSLLKLMDACLGLTFSLIEDKTSAVQRRPKYGALGDFRRQEHGGFEYRTLPSWLVTPQITRAAIALGYIVVKEQHELGKVVTMTDELLENYFKGNVVEVRAYVEHMFAQLERLDSYKEVEEWLLPLMYMVKVGKRWSEEQDVTKSWKLHVFQ